MSARRTLVDIGLALGATLLTLIAAEQALRALGYDYKPLQLYAHNPDRRSVHLFLEQHFVYDPDLIWRPRPGAAVFKAQGFRGPELPAVKPAGERWLFAVGDSNTLGWDGEDGANWPAEDEIHFNDEGHRRAAAVVLERLRPLLVVPQREGGVLTDAGWPDPRLATMSPSRRPSLAAPSDRWPPSR